MERRFLMAGLCASLFLGMVSKGNAADATTEKSILESLRSPSQREAERFATQLEKAILDNDSKTFEAAVDWKAIIGTSVAGLKLTKEDRADLIDGFQQGLALRGGLAGEIGNAIRGGGSYKFLRIHDVKGQKRALFRLILGNGGGFNYHDMVLHREATGTVKIVDFHVAISGELMSDTLRRFFVPFVALSNQEALGKEDQEFVDNAETIQGMAANMKSNPQKTENLYQTLPASLKKDKSILMIRLQATAQLDPEVYSDTLETYRKFYPNDPSIDMVSIDAYLLKEEFDEALGCINRVDKALGGDPYLELMRSAIYTLMGQEDQAEKARERAFQKEPGLRDLE